MSPSEFLTFGVLGIDFPSPLPLRKLGTPFDRWLVFGAVVDVRDFRAEVAVDTLPDSGLGGRLATLESPLGG
jgi:hypothetical protein